MDWAREMVEALMRAQNGEKAKVIAAYEGMTGKSAQTLYRIAKRHGYQVERKTRKDKGELSVTRDQAAVVAGYMEATKREIKGQIMPVNVALEIAEQRGLIDPGSISPDRMRAALRLHGFDKKTVSAPQPRTMMKSLHPNHVHVFDASVCIQYYLKAGSRLAIMDERKFYRNKPENYKATKTHIIRYVLVDHYSHAIYVKYYQAAGENAESVYDFLLSAWGPKANPKLPFRGVPRFLLMDAGSANICKPMRHFLDGMGIETPKNLPHNPARQGSAEVAQNIVETHFECRLGIQPAYSIEELNDWALDWAAWWNASQIHKRHGMTRAQCWLTITKEQLHEVDRDLCNALYAAPTETRKVTPQYTISYRPQGKNYESRRYSLRHLPDIAPSDTVSVMLRPLVWPEIGVIWRDTEYAIKPIETGHAGFASDAAVIGEEYKAVPESPAQRFQKEAANLAYGEGGKAAGSSAFPGGPIMGNLSERIRHDFLPRAGVPHRIKREDMPERMVSVMDVFIKLGRVTPEINRQIREVYGASLPEHEADRIIGEIRATGGFTPPAPAPAAAQEGAC